jgi:hypothetical protein
MHLDSYVGGGPDSIAYMWMAESVRSMLPLILRFGVATAEEIDAGDRSPRVPAQHAGRSPYRWFRGSPFTPPYRYRAPSPSGARRRAGMH